VGASREELLSAARVHMAGGQLIIAFADSRHADLTMNWLVALALKGISN
jgi:hypothetical protein